MPRILITGCSSGFGQAIAARFLDEGWEVVATMRTPAAEGLPISERLRTLPLDVTQPLSIEAALAEAGPIDALVNNAGVGMLNVLEGTAIDKARELFEINVLGTMAMTQAVMPAMRQRRAGVIVNISSSVTLRPLPALSIYSASKAAVNAFTQSFALEAAEFGVRARLVLPGSAPETSFGKNAVARMGMEPTDPSSKPMSSPGATRPRRRQPWMWQTRCGARSPISTPRCGCPQGPMPRPCSGKRVASRHEARFLKL